MCFVFYVVCFVLDVVMCFVCIAMYLFILVLFCVGMYFLLECSIPCNACCILCRVCIVW